VNIITILDVEINNNDQKITISDHFPMTSDHNPGFEVEPSDPFFFQGLPRQYG
jgi:hypothetical protein